MQEYENAVSMQIADLCFTQNYQRDTASATTKMPLKTNKTCGELTTSVCTTLLCFGLRNWVSQCEPVCGHHPHQPARGFAWEIKRCSLENMHLP